METQLKESLTHLMTAIKAGDGAGISSHMQRVEDLLAAGRAQFHPQLVHFLENRSYAKAVLFLGGAADIPAGTCGGRAGRTPA